jgi:hypothetical protein
VPVRGPDVFHLLLIASAADEELVVPPCSTAIAKRTFRRVDILWGLAIELPDSDESFWEEEEKGCEDGLVLSGEFPPLENVIIVIPGSVAKRSLGCILEQVAGTLTRSRSYATRRWHLPGHRRTNLPGMECYRLSRLMVRRSNLRRWSCLCRSDRLLPSSGSSSREGSPRWG